MIDIWHLAVSATGVFLMACMIGWKARRLLRSRDTRLRRHGARPYLEPRR